MMSSTRRAMNQSTIRASIYASNVTKTISVASRKTDDNRRSLRAPVKIVHQNGVDCTPLPLLGDDKKIKDEKDTPSDNISQGSNYTLSIGSFIGTNPLAITRSKSQQSSSGFTVESSSSMSEDTGDVVPQSMQVFTEVKTIKQETVEIIKDSELEKPVEVVLEETETMWIYDMAPKMFQRESNDSAEIEKRNKAYEILLGSRAGNDKYVERGMNTFENASITKAIQTNRIGHSEVGSMAAVWDIHDRYLDLAEREQTERGEGTKDENIDITASPNATAGEEKPKLETGGGGGSPSPSPIPENPSVKNVTTSRSATGIDKTQESVSAHSESDLFGTRQSTATSSTNHDSQAKIEEILTSDQLAYSLFVMERALNMNTYFEKMLYYRNLPYYAELMQDLKIPLTPAPEEREDNYDDRSTENETGERKSQPAEAASKHHPEPMPLDLTRASLFSSHRPHLESLWKFSINFTKNRNVATIAWNRQNTDILAVAYGEYDYSNQKSGLVCCWSLKNIDYPERSYKLPYGATAISWSRTHSNLLAVGMFNGTIMVFDVRKKSGEAVVDTKHASGRHIGPVRQMEWVVRVSGRSEEHSEVLISISADGRVTQWSVRKGFECSDLMKLKRIATRIPISNKQKKTDAIISQYAVGSCFDFNPRDSNLYLAGVEEGHIHKCSSSYNEQYLENFYGHTASVYSIKWSPFLTDVFLSCSADWTIKLWHIERQSAVLNIQSSVKAVNSISWSPKSSVVFACVNESAVEVWNLQISTLDPIIMENICSEFTVLTTVTFTNTGDCLIVGDSEGALHTFSLRNMGPSPQNQAEALDKTIKSCIASQLQK